MRKIILSITALSVLLLIMSAFMMKEESFSGAFRGAYIQSVSVPQGWSINNGGFKGAVIQNSNEPKVKISINTISVDTELKFMESIIADQIESYRETASALFEVHKSGTFMVDKKKHIAYIRHVYGAKPARYQAIAYIGEVGQVVTIALMCDDGLLFQEYLQDFKSFVESYTVYSEQDYMALNTEKEKNSETPSRISSPIPPPPPSKKTYY